MTEDFHIFWDSGQRTEGQVHYFMAPRFDRIKALLPMLYPLLESQVDLSGEHVCPICRESMDIKIYYLDLSQDPLTISAFCKTCNIHDFFRSNKIPLWAKKFPRDFPEAMEFISKLGKHGDENT